MNLLYPDKRSPCVRVMKFTILKDYSVVNTTTYSVCLTAAVAQSVREFASHAEGRLGVRIPAATDQSKMLGNRYECQGSSEMTIINGCRVSQ